MGFARRCGLGRPGISKRWFLRGGCARATLSVRVDLIEPTETHRIPEAAGRVNSQCRKRRLFLFRRRAFETRDAR